MLYASFLMRLWLALFPGEDEARQDRAKCQVIGAHFYQRGVEVLAEDRFSVAALNYQWMLTSGWPGNPRTFLDLGNAEFLSGKLQIAAAIIAYHHGLRQDPSDSTLRRHLEVARDHVRYPPASVPLRPPPVSPWPAALPWLLLLGEVLFAVGCLVTLFWAMRGGSLRMLAAAGLIGCSALCVAAWGLGQWRVSQENALPLVVVSAEEVPLLRGNGPTFLPHPMVPAVRRGMEGRKRMERGGWVQVEFPGEIIGWLSQDDVLVGTP